jgi:hypothetical protein
MQIENVPKVYIIDIILFISRYDIFKNENNFITS